LVVLKLLSVDTAAGGSLDERLREVLDFAGLHAPQIGVQAIRREQLLVASTLDDSAVFDDENPIGVLDRRRRWAIASVVRPAVSQSSDRWMRYSVSVSTLAVASSSRTIAES